MLDYCSTSSQPRDSICATSSSFFFRFFSASMLCLTSICINTSTIYSGLSPTLAQTKRQILLSPQHSPSTKTIPQTVATSKNRGEVQPILLFFKAFNWVICLIIILVYVYSWGSSIIAQHQQNHSLLHKKKIMLRIAITPIWVKLRKLHIINQICPKLENLLMNYNTYLVRPNFTNLNPSK